MRKLYLVLSTQLKRQDYFLQHLKKMGAQLMERPEEAEGILVIGGDGAMLRAIHTFYKLEVPFLGLNFGHIGFLMNKPKDATIKEILAGDVDYVSNRLLQADLYNRLGRIGRRFAFNDFYFERSSTTAANVKVAIDGIERLKSLICDGIIVASAAGSTAYNASAGGVVLPIDSSSMVLTGISPYLFNYWKTSQLSGDSRIELTALNISMRPVRFIADGMEIPDVTKVIIKYSGKKVKIGFTRSENFKEKTLNIQFLKRRSEI